MSKLDELMQELCPEGVEYRTLTELFNTRNGYTPSKSKKEYWENGTTETQYTEAIIRAIASIKKK